MTRRLIAIACMLTLLIAAAVPLDGPLGEMACGAVAGAAFARGAAMTVPRVIRFIPL